MSDPNYLKVVPNSAETLEQALAGITGINVSNQGVASNEKVEFATNEKVDSGSSKIKHFVKVGHRLIEVSSGNEEEQILEVQRMGILQVPKQPKSKASRPKDVLAPGFKKRRHKILERIKARKKGK